MNYTIYQIRSLEDIAYAFVGWEFASNHEFNLNDYSEVYSGSIQDGDPYILLESLFAKFNASRPRDFEGHSLSVSDVVKFSSNDDKDHFYYCDRFGWQDITLFM